MTFNVIAVASINFPMHMIIYLMVFFFISLICIGKAL